jgi:putative SOS response-associated peptidase YedK
MCGRFTLRNPAQVYAAYLRRAGVGAGGPRFNVAPGQRVEVVRGEPGGDWETEELVWGFIPRWTRPEAKPIPLINARSESVADKPAFRDAFRYRRCLVPADGFYEWRRENSRKWPYFFRLRGDQPFALAALWEEWWSASGESVRSFCLLTTEANSVLAPIHDRMPVMLDPAGAVRWLETSPAEAGARLTPLLRPFPPDAMEVIAVSPWVNKADHEGPRCLEPREGGAAEQMSLL